MAGPSVVEDEQQFESAAAFAVASGASFLRAGGSKYRPLDEARLDVARRTAERHGLLLVCEVSGLSSVSRLQACADLLQVGARHMNDDSLLEALGSAKHPVLIERNHSATIEELLMAAETVLSGGNYNVLLCERGIRTFETYSRYTMDLGAIPIVKKLSHLPILADPSHGTGRRDKVLPMGRAAVAAGADGLIVEVHPDPDNALQEGAQSLGPAQFAELMNQCRLIAGAVGRKI
jgi:3-deoxy-7-phosphoheptulonate synthase